MKQNTRALRLSCLAVTVGTILCPAQTPTVTHTGCLLVKEGHFLQQDEATQEVFELRGPDLNLNVDNRVQTGGHLSTAKPGVAPAIAVVDVVSVSPRVQGGCLTVASKLKAQANPLPSAAPVPPSGRTGKKGGQP